MRRLRALALLSLPLLFSGCKGLGALFKVLAVAAYVTVRVAAAAATSSHSSSSQDSRSSTESTQRSRTVESSGGPTNTTVTSHCLCPYDPHGVMSCAADDVCRLTCDEGWVFRQGVCVPGERPQNIDDYP